MVKLLIFFYNDAEFRIKVRFYSVSVRHLLTDT